MTIPSFRSLASQKSPGPVTAEQPSEEEINQDDEISAVHATKKEAAANKNMTEEKAALNNDSQSPAGVNIKIATAMRKKWIAASSILFALSVIFLILTIIGNTNNKPVIRSTYFLKLNLANIIPASTPADIILVNSLARSLGLHDFYQVGLWNFCEGYDNEGISYCAKPKARFWFNPVEILLNELLSGATIALPADINKILDLIKLASNVMFCFFIAGACVNWVSIFIAPITLYSRWWSFPFVIWTFFGALFTTVATIIVTAMSIIFVNVSTSQPGLHIGASIGRSFFAFMWIATACSISGWLIHMCLLCCCASRRDVLTGRKMGRTTQITNTATNERAEP